ncbi:MAG: hypothetical protein M1830_005773, partial [Pleopsidium flavum]
MLYFMESSHEILDIIFALLEAGSVVNVQDNQKENALHHICMSTHAAHSEDVAEILLRFGIDSEVEDHRGHTALVEALYNPATDMPLIKTLLGHVKRPEPQPRHRNNKSTSTMLHGHSLRGCEEELEDLLQDVFAEGLDISLKTKMGGLLLAAQSRAVQSRLLDCYSKKISVQELESQHPFKSMSRLRVALRERHQKITELLLTRGKTDFNEKNKDGRHLIHWAA